MSLYAGINLKGVKPSSATSVSESSSSSSTLQRPGDASAAGTAPSTAATESSTSSTSSTSGQWSAALRFAPVARKRPNQANPQRSVQPIIASSFVASTSSPASTASTAAPASSSAGLTLSTESKDKNDNIVANAYTRNSSIKAPPSMTLDDNDVNGFSQSAAGKKAAKKSNWNQNHSSGNNAAPSGKRTTASGNAKDPNVLFGDLPYDPLRPCDYYAYKAWINGVRIQRRLEKEEARRRERSRSRSSYSSSSGSESDGEGRDDEQVYKKARLFAPPTSYEPSISPAASTEAPPPPPPVAPAQEVNREETGEEAYLRRVAMSQGAGNPTRAPPPPTPVVPIPQATHAPLPLPNQEINREESGEEAYLRRVAMSGTPLHAGPQSRVDTIPSFPANSNDTPSSSMSGGQTNDSAPTPQVMLDAQARAREIAERLGKMAKFAVPPPTPALPTPAASDNMSGPAQQGVEAAPYDPSVPFAQRMMAKFGWEQGKGLGASESGITTALSIAKGSANKSQSKSKNDSGTPNIAARSSQIVDASKEGRRARTDEKWGPPSRVVLLTNMVSIDDVDDELSSEVAEEANKIGVVERCFVYLVPGEVRPDEQIRIFLVMSGLAGGYNTCRQFDGRFFGGRTVRARFYDEGAFGRGVFNI